MDGRKKWPSGQQALADAGAKVESKAEGAIDAVKDKAAELKKSISWGILNTSLGPSIRVSKDSHRQKPCFQKLRESGYCNPSFYAHTTHTLMGCVSGQSQYKGDKPFSYATVSTSKLSAYISLVTSNTLMIISWNNVHKRFSVTISHRSDRFYSVLPCSSWWEL